ncbi:MAG: exodeoxyribonuclease III [Oscillatoriales cyanobacterium RM2_1_1]|nr:exodeoxyribonuclease III [Oscillatoriales cyanobacterium SM2_3_0]NJO45375.1 exodeoxyribonuclease III [Oscillatoriales cyanobacterium RM2_1_1]
MKIATWNVNSIRTRQDHVVNWLLTNPVDLLCLQETKVVDPDFPRSPFEALGYKLYVFGQKAYNGVAIFSREPAEKISLGFSGILAGESHQELDVQTRVISIVIHGIRIVNLYVPNGESLSSAKYTYKLNWLKVLRKYLETILQENPNLCICGDFNIALEDRDIHNPEDRKNHIMASDEERQALQTILDLGLADGFRKFTSESGYFSWWDYRAAAFRRNLGWRIDHHYLTSDLYQKAVCCTIDKAPRSWEKPSDHAPVILELDL